MPAATRCDHQAEAAQDAVALYSEVYADADGEGIVNTVRYLFLNNGAREFSKEWDKAIGQGVSLNS